MNKPIVIGITGGSASGKTFFLDNLLRRFIKGQVCLLSQDNYYKNISQVPKDENGVENFDLPDAIDFDLFSKHIQQLVAGQEVVIKEYTFNNANATPIFLTFKPAPVIVVEGIFVLHDLQIAQWLNLKVFIDAKEHLMIKRRIIRDNNERGYDTTDVLYRWEKHIAPTFEQYIKPCRNSADLIINNNTGFERGLDVLSAYIEKFLMTV